MILNMQAQYRCIPQKANQQTKPNSIAKSLGKNPFIANSADTVSFSGFTKVMSQKIYADGEKDVAEILKNSPHKKKIVGKLPNFFVKLIDKNQRNEVINDVYKAFGEAANVLRAEGNTQKASKILNDNLQKNKLIGKFDEIELEYLDKGGRGKAYKISGLYDCDKEDDFIIKVFHTAGNENWHQYKNDGCFAEINRASYWVKNASQDTHRGKFFWGDLDSGYMINKFIDLDTRIAKKRPDERSFGLLPCDESRTLDGHNRIKGYNYDWGGLKLENRVLSDNKVARVFYNKIKNTPQEKRAAVWMKHFRERTANDIDKKAGLANAIELMGDKPFLMDLMLKQNSTKINQALSYTLKSLPYEDSIKYFDKLVQTNDKLTQIILFNEFGKLPKDKIANYYSLAEKNAMPSTVEHLASSVSLLPDSQFFDAYTRLAKNGDDATMARMIHKFSMLDNERKPFAAKTLLENTQNPKFVEEIKGKLL